MIPPFDEDGLLPAGIHEATWEEFEARFGFHPQRRALLLGMRAAMDDRRASVALRKVFMR